jgi:NADPH:quinone reductase-like Zn-dependent oxidoreductase
LVRSTGADHVIDYTVEDPTRSGAVYDLRLDCAGSRSLSALRRALKPDGISVIAAGRTVCGWVHWHVCVTALAISPFVSQKLVPFIANPNSKDLATIAELMASAKVRLVIDRCYSLAENAEAIRYLEQVTSEEKS